MSINPRLWKEAFFYEKRGYEVIVVTMWQSTYFLEKDLELLKGHSIRYIAYLNLIAGEIKPLNLFFYRARKRVGGELQQRFNIATNWAISYAPERLLKKALEENADLYCAHLECAFYVGRDLIKAGKKVAFDFEDWYSNDYLEPRRPVKLLKEVEKFALENGVFCTAASKSMADAVKTFYDNDNKVTVIYNGFSIIESVVNKNQEKPEENPLRLLWFSRTIGPDRGIEYLLKALHLCRFPVELHLLGIIASNYEHYLLKESAGLIKHKLKIHQFISHSELPAFISQFKIGLAFEENINNNRQVTITNKILQYLQAGLFVLASNTQGHREVSHYFPDSVLIVNIENSFEVIKALEILKSKQRNIEQNIFNSVFSWEAQEEKFISLEYKYL